MNKISIILLVVLLSSVSWMPSGNSHITENNIPPAAKLLMKYYPQIAGYSNNSLLFKDGSSLVFNDSITNKTPDQLLNNPDIEDQFAYPYSKGNTTTSIQKKQDPGRIRSEEFFKKIYGSTREAVRKNLVEITWCPKLTGQKILVTKVNGVHEKVKKISDELDEHPEFSEYIKNIGGTFNWRFINGTKRLSMHSFGMTIDINTKFSNYWQWECKCTNEQATLTYKNKIPQKIIDIFEKYGFIWGGKWYHYDTMHFEYRPELLESL